MRELTGAVRMSDADDYVSPGSVVFWDGDTCCQSTPTWRVSGVSGSAFLCIKGSIFCLLLSGKDLFNF